MHRRQLLANIAALTTTAAFAPAAFAEDYPNRPITLIIPWTAGGPNLGWFPQGREIALKGFERLLKTARSPDGAPGYVHSLASDGAVIDASRDTYDHAFVLLALATLYQATEDAQVRAEMESVVGLFDRELRGRLGGFVEGIPPRLPRRQNPHMHAFEALIAVYEATGDAIFQTRAGDLYSLFVRNLFDPEIKMVGEYYDERWNPLEPVLVEPGHQAEWLWLLRCFERITGCPTARHRTMLLDAMLKFRDPLTGCLLDEVDGAGAITKSTRRLWPQTEMAKAWIAQAESNEPDAADQARAALVRLEQHYLRHPVAGGWYDQFDSAGHSLVEFIPASSFYHVLCAVAEADRVLG